MKRSFYIIFTFCLLISSCQKEIPFEGDQAERKLVINAVLTAGKEIVVNASSSAPITSNLSPEFLTNATVEMWRGDQYLGVLQSDGDGKYLLDHIVAPGNYRLVASAPGLRSVSAETKVPETTLVEIGDVELDSPPFNEDYASYDRKVEVIINDPQEENFYLLRYLFINDVNLFDQTFHSTDPNIERDSDVELHNVGALINDNGFNGQRYGLDVNIFGPQFEEQASGFLLETINEDYARYIRSYRAGDGDGFFGEPVQYYSNVENGIGVFCANAQLLVVLPD